MNQMRMTKSNITSTKCFFNKKPTLLRSDDDYERWYREQFDFSMFTENEIQEVIEEERPDYYPCIPIIHGSGYEVVYLGEDLVKLWFNQLYKITLTPL